MNDREMDRLIRATYSGLRARGRPARRGRAWVPAVALAAAVVAGLALGAALGRSRVTPAEPADPAAATPSAPATAGIRGPAPTPRTPAPTSAGSTASSAVERDLWSTVRSRISDPAAVMVPTWLPSAVDRSVLNAMTAPGPNRVYEVGYGGSGSVTFTMGPTEPERAGQSAIGLTVRGHPAVLSHPSDADSRPGLPKQLAWSEDGRHYGIRSEALSGDDLMRIAWSLEASRPPARPFPYRRERVGACSVPGVEADALVRRLLSIAGNGDPDAVADCLALEVLEGSAGGGRGWASLPRARDVVVHGSYWFGGRQIVSVSWTFERDPGGAWGPSSHRFFMVGQEGDRLRVYGVWTAPASLPR